METTTNPFEPPRATDLDPVAKGPRIVPQAALRELIAAAPWVGRLAVLTALSILIGVLDLAFDLARPLVIGKKLGFLLVSIGTVVISVLFLRVLRRYAAASARLRGGDPTAVGRIVDAMASYLKTAGVVVLIAASAFVVYLAVGIGSGRWFSWVRS